MGITPLKHYSIPAKCQADNTGCPFTNMVSQAWEPRYAELKLADGDLLRDEEFGEYTPQGGCTDGTFIYRAFVKADEEPTILQKLTLDGQLVLSVANTSYGHANDMTYCSKDGLLYIAHSSSTNIVYKVNPDTLALVDTINVGPTIWGIAYNEVDDVFVLGNVGAAYLSVYTYDFEFMYRIKPQNAFSGSVRQGITCDGNYIYVNLDNAYGTQIGNDQGSRVMIYTWNAMFIKSYFINIKEIEFMAINGSEMIIGTYEGRNVADNKVGKLYKVKFDLYPDQTNQTGRPTDVSGGMNNLQRLPEGTMVRLWKGNLSSGSFSLQTPSRLKVTEDGPFRYLKVRFKGANDRVVDWFPVQNGVLTLSETDITNAVNDTTFRMRECRVIFNQTDQTFTIDTNQNETLFYDASEEKITVTKDTTGELQDLISITQIWGVV